ncbi:Rhs family protein [Acinetobacter bereziniae]|nr:Rhs family protein [Acinetobacter bereziniae]
MSKDRALLCLKRKDQETGLHYNRYRYYSPYVGRFVSKDPIKIFGGLNLYNYTFNPINWVDKLGLTQSSGCTVYSRPEVISKVSSIVKLHQGAIKEIAPDAGVGIRGSLVTGVRSNGQPWSQQESDIDGYVASKALFGDGTNRYPRELKPIENSINGAIKLALPCLGNKEKVFSFKTQRQNFPTNAERFGEKIVKIF